jgi:hypothetical protein
VKYLVIALLASTAAFAEDAPPPNPTPPVTAQPTPPAAPPTSWLLELDSADITTLNMCVGELPYKVADPFVKKIQGKIKPAGK